jgi:hypothetical protein
MTITTTSLSNGQVGTYYSTTLSATGGSGSYTWVITSGSLPAGLTLSTSGTIYGTPTTATTYSFAVLCYDTASHSATSTFSIYIITSSSSTITISTTSLASGVVGTYYSSTLAATGGSGSYTWTLSSGSLPTGLTLNTSGVIYGTPTTASTYTFTILCYDTASHSTTSTFTIYISSSSSSSSTLTISTAILSSGVVGTYYSSTLAATGGSAPFTWALSSSSLPAGLTMSSAGVISGTPTTAATNNFTVVCYDTASHVTTGTLSIYISSSSSSTITISTTSLSSGVVGTYYSSTLAAIGGSGSYTWALSSGSLPTGLTLSSSGTIYGTPTTTSTYTFTLLCYDTASHSTTGTLSIYISSTSSSSSTITISTTSLASGVVGTSYSTTLAATGGSGSYTWTLSSGSLPTGLTLNTSGVIYGTPTTASTYTFTVLCYDTASHSSVGTFTIYISSSSSSSSSTITISAASLSSGVVGTYYSSTLAATGGAGSYIWALSSGSLPTGLTLSSSGVISGTPTVASIFNFAIVCSDTAAHATTGTFTIYISSSSYSTLAISTTSLSNGTINTFYSATLTATGGSGSYIWSLSSGSLPTGLTLSTSGIIFGTPTVTSTSSFTVLVYDTNSNSTTKTLSIFISSVSASTLSISTASLSNGTVGINYSATLAASGGSNPYTWKLSDGSLPTGLTLSETGVISGTPNVASTYSFTVLVYDTASNAITKAFSVTISPALAISTTSLSNGTVGSNYSATLEASGGNSPYTWKLTDGSLPTGTTLNSTGVISGTPTTAATYNFTVLVTDTNSLTASKTLSIITSNPPPLSITTSSLSNGTVNASYSSTLAASGGNSPYTWALTDGSLPTGTTLGSTGAISGTPTTAATYSFTITVNDSNSHTAVKPYSVTIAPAPAPAPATAPATTTPSPTSKTPSTSSNTTNKSGPANSKSSFDFTIPIICIIAILGLLIIARIIWMVVKNKRNQ